MFLICVFALVLAAPAAASRDDVWWDEDRAASVLLDSDLAFELEADDAECDGWGAYRLGRDGSRTYRRFVCQLYSEREAIWCLPRECASDHITFTCRPTIRFRTTSAKRFLILSSRSRCTL